MPKGRNRARTRRASKRGDAHTVTPSSSAVLFTVEQLLAHARELSRVQTFSTEPGPRVTPVLSAAEQAGDVLLDFHAAMSAAVRERRAVPPATEWLLDNFYLVEEQILRIRKDLPKGFGRELPHLTEGSWATFPRVYQAVAELIEHTDARLDEDYLYRYIRAYQEKSPLTIGETWAVPIMLRAALLENLGGLAAHVGAAHEADSAADEAADALLARVPATGGRLERLLDDAADGHREHGTRFLLRLQLRLRDRDVVPDEIAAWVDEQTAALPDGLEAARTAQHHRQAAQQVSVANTITSIRFVNALDWHRFFEGVNRVEAVLREDPAGVYERMDFDSRDRYRDAVEDLSRRCPASEGEVARAAVSRAREARDRDSDDPALGHVGWYLIRGGRYDFENELRYRPHNREHVYRGPLRRGGFLFWGLLLVITAALAGLLALHLLDRGAGLLATAFLCLLAIVPLSDAAVTIANRVSVGMWPPRPLPALDYRLRLSAAQRTLVVVVALVRTPEEATEIASRLEVNYLTGRQDPNVHFALVCEPIAGDEERLPGDTKIRTAAIRAIRDLNRTHGPRSTRPFHLFVRGRTYHETEELWMGWERKRGALHELCQLLRGDDGGFELHEGDDSFLEGVNYVLTLDADTMLPRDGVRRLVSIIHHPLNRPRIDPELGRVTRGYGVVQPRVSPTLASSARTHYSWMHTGTEGIDPYGGVVSDVYQDVFGEGSFTGKAIFDVDTYLEVLGDRFPEARILSHDLIEGNYLRCGLATDVEVFDDFPSTYASAVQRQHRWTRGDWQIASWLLPRVPSPRGSERNVLSLLHRWKLSDNLRRSLVAPSLMAMIVVGWAFIPVPDPWWLAFIFALTFFPAILQFLDSLVRRPRRVSTRRAWRALLADLRRDSSRAVFALATLPHAAWTNADAIVRSQWRLHVSGKGLLEWVTSAEAEALADASRMGHFRSMGLPVAASVLAALPAVAVEPMRALLALPMLGLWVASPLIAHGSSRGFVRERETVTPDDLRYLRRVARRTWRFFDDFVRPEDHWLIPDNYQEDPGGVIARRTSPTNVGLQILAYSTAHDMGYIGLPDLVDRATNTLTVLAGLKRFRGHFLNWYDTETLEPLQPQYVSTVDSGNLCGHLIAFRRALLEAIDAPFIGPQTLRGLADTTQVAIADVREALDRGADRKASLEGLQALLDLILDADVPATLVGWLRTLREVESQASITVPRVVEALPEEGLTLRAAEDILRDVRRRLGEIDTYAPWAHVAARIPDAVTETRGDEPWPAALRPYLEGTPSVRRLAEPEAALSVIDEILAGLPDDEVRAWWESLFVGIESSQTFASQLLAHAELAADMAHDVWIHTDFRVVYDADRKLFSIGFNTAEGRRDASYYDMLASECRLASFLAVAKGDVPQSHWFRLGRAITTTGEGYALLSWSASMFEYLMPLLVMRRWPGTLLDETYFTVVRRQIEYGRQQRVPWGISESAFATQDAQETYQYQAFGVPGLGLKRGLLDDVVVAPYATVLALPVEPHLSVVNLRALEERGAKGHWGFFEAIDYTPGRIPAGEQRAVIKAYMAHHQGMSLVTLGNMLAPRTMQDRFHSDPVVRSAEVLLQERAPRHIEVEHPHVEEVEYVRSVREIPQPHARSYPTADTPVPATHFLSNGTYSVMVTNAGGGYSRCRGLDVSRYREDVTRDCWGTFIYVREAGEGDAADGTGDSANRVGGRVDGRDAEGGRAWSATYQPTLVEPDEYHVIFSADQAEFRRTDGEIETHTEVVVSPEHDVEVRRVTLTNHGREARTLEVTSYFEATLAPNAADQAHRTFSNLFVETEALPTNDVIFFTRRPRSPEDARLWGFHAVACETDTECEPSIETDRRRFVGRLRQPSDPAALDEIGPLSGTTGPVLDPVCAIRETLTIQPGETGRLAFATGVADNRRDAAALAETYRDIRASQRALDLSWTSSQIVLRDLGISPEEAVVFQRLASRLLLTDPYSPLKVRTPVENGLPLSALWSLGISGDHPILLVRIERLEDTPIVRQALLAHQYWRHTGLVSDLVVLNTQPSAYTSELHDRLNLLVRTGHALGLLDRPGGIFLRRADQMNADVRTLLETVARAVIDGDRGSLLLQLNQRGKYPDLPPHHVRSRQPAEHPPVHLDRPALANENGFGGFDPETGEYVIALEEGDATPAPWVNVLANEGGFGALVTEAGVTTTWDLNSHENRLTTWNNDPVSDGSGETVYVRDEETGELWSPTLLPIPGEGPHIVRHGFGHTTFAHATHGIGHELTIFIPPDEPIRVARLTLTNASEHRRVLSATQFVEWALGSSRSQAQQRVVTWYDTECDLLTAHNHFNPDFPGRTAFLAADRHTDSYTGSRSEFLGRNGSPDAPAGLAQARLGAQIGRFHDAAGAIQVRVPLDPGQSATVSFLLGQTDDLEQARALVERYRAAGAVDAAIERTRAYWSDLLGTLEVATPDPAIDRLVNGWPLYQALACRLWGRTALYQSSGAIGFRDQLQDSLAFLLARPEIVRDRIVDAARRQFPEGDVMHWWMPISGRGVRTRITDDRHWLPYVTAAYLEATGDTSVLDEVLPYVEGATLEPDQEDLYFEPRPDARSTTVYEHCLAALDSAATGTHGLPLMGGGDWNDGMNLVGRDGEGESVWLAWFLDVTLRRFADVCEARGDTERGRELRARAAAFVAAIDEHAWDGDWYLRAFFDDGAPLGTHTADECRIDAIAQAWATISSAGDPARASRALASVEEHLVDTEADIVRLLTPPFDDTPHDPGYIKGYVPGVRENGGQYTHAATWVALAHLLRGDADRGYDLIKMLDPSSHADTREGAERYVVEPYAVAADIYSNPAHLGRGGWTWYTGSAGWLYRVTVEALLGIERVAVPGGYGLRVSPRLPSAWRGFEAVHRAGDTRLDIRVVRADHGDSEDRGTGIWIDDEPIEGDTIPVPESGTYRVEVRLAGEED